MIVHYSASFGAGKQDGRVGYYVWDLSLPFCKAVQCLDAQSCPTLCDPINCSLSGSSVHGDSPGKNPGVGCHAFLQRIFPSHGLSPGLQNCRQILYHLSHQGSQEYWHGKHMESTICLGFRFGHCDKACGTLRRGILWKVRKARRNIWWPLTMKWTKYSIQSDPQYKRKLRQQQQSQSMGQLPDQEMVMMRECIPTELVGIATMF